MASNKAPVAAPSTLRSAVMRTIHGVGAWSRPTFTQPMIIDAGQLKPLGEHRGSKWYASKWGDLEASRRLLHETDVLPDGLLLRSEPDDEGRTYRWLAVHQPGEFERITTAVAVPPKPKPAARPTDALAGVAMLTRPATGFAAGNRPATQIRGAEAIVAKLSAVGVELALDVTGTRLVIMESGGRATPHRAVAIAAAPLLVPFLRDGTPPACQVSAHPKPVPAVTIAADSVPWCGARECVAVLWKRA